MSSFFQNLSAAFASFNSSPRRPRTDDPQRPLDQHRRKSVSQQRAHSPSPRHRSPPSPTAESRWHRKRAKNEFSLDLEDHDRHRLDLTFESPRDIAAPQVCTGLPELPYLSTLPAPARFLLSFTSLLCSVTWNTFWSAKSSPRPTSFRLDFFLFSLISLYAETDRAFQTAQSYANDSSFTPRPAPFRGQLRHSPRLSVIDSRAR